jgi:predicted HTH transcriptional regulator
LSSTPAHSTRLKVFDSLTEFLKENGKMSKVDVENFLIRVYRLSRTTAHRYIEDLVIIGVAKNNGDFLEYIWNKKEHK